MSSDVTIDIAGSPSYLALYREFTVFSEIQLRPMARTPQDITDAELAVLNLLWTRGRSTVRELTDVLYPNGTGAHYATVQKLLERLEIKKFVKRDRKPWPHQFDSRVDREELIGRRLQTTADKLCGGSLVPLMNHLVKSQLSPEDRRSLRGLLDELETGVH